MNQILVATDFSDHAARAMDYAAMLAKLHGARLELMTAVYVTPLPLGPYAINVPTDTLDLARERSKAKLDEIATELRGKQLEVSTYVAFEDASTAISVRAKEIGADLLVMGTRGRGALAHVFLGSVAERSARLVPCPVLTTHADGLAPSTFKTILVPTDFSSHSSAALQWARSLAATNGAKLVLVHSTYQLVFPSESTAFVGADLSEALRRDAENRLEELTRSISDCEVVSHVSSDPPSISVLDEARRSEADLIVMGTHGRTGVTHMLMGSVAERVIRQSEIPVVTVKGENSSNG